MNAPGRVLVAGLGSPHGDDQAGWLVAENIATQFRTHPRIVVRRAMIPLDVLDWLEGIDILHVCDACDIFGDGNDRDGSEAASRDRKLHRLTWDADQMMDSDNSGKAAVNASLKSLRGRGSHDFGLPDVLRLAEKTGLLPKRVIIWAIEGSCFRPEDLMSNETRETALQAVDELTTELSLSHA